VARTDSCDKDRKPGRICISCDNRHGCRTPEPLCLRLERSDDERRLQGRSLMARRGLLAECEACCLFRRCWAPDEYRSRLQRG